MAESNIQEKANSGIPLRKAIAMGEECYSQDKGGSPVKKGSGSGGNGGSKSSGY
jgi:hypothetical protein